ncbi:uncharacterized protein LOC9646477 [Selaginella moellendorffii]|uniref:uncharacterized protein LOC9646477 n=1 Tax=Selaginella moellendorffii TaxID=88036 RepID=UPI000D1CB8E7|nr:uncharacterized protein LOC9646477 [Selaginella moellendorffii]|eukprot:XP_024522406.1 uncharacterized protein LOC9646477 [Selaginella moellendorffii]
MAVPRAQLEAWLIDTASPDDALRSSATAAIASAEAVTGFAECLLAISADQNGTQAIAAATYFKNFLRAHWAQKEKIHGAERKNLREQLLEVLLRVDSIVLNLLTEAFRIVASHDFSGQEKSWQELVPALHNAVKNSDLVADGSTAPAYKTLNALLAIQAITKPFQYFLDPTVAREPVPPLLELISSDLLVPLHGFFHHLVEQALKSKEKGFAPHDNVLLVIAKTFHLAIGSHMPASVLSCLKIWIGDVLALLDIVNVDQTMDLSEQFSRLKVWKRCLQICCTLVARHRKHTEQFLSAISAASLKIVGSHTTGKDIHVAQERIISLAFDLLANILETGPGWRLLSPQFSSLLEKSIVSALVLSQKDVADWNDDEDEYLRKNLPSDLDESCGWRDDLLTPRRSALNLLGVIATSKGPAGAGKTPNKRKKGKNKDARGTAGELLVMPYLSRYPLPTDGTCFESTVSYFGVLLAYGALQQFFKSQSAEYLKMILLSRVFPIYSLTPPSPFLLANANWLLGELATCLPEDLKQPVFDSLISAMLAENVGGVSWRPARASAAAALAALLEEDYKPVKWFPLLQAIVSSVKSGADDARHALQLLTTTVETGEEDAAVHVPYLVVSIKDELLRHLPAPPDLQVVELGFSSMAALAHCWDSAEPGVSKNDEEPIKNWREGCITLRNTFAQLLQRAWICSPENDAEQGKTPPSCLNDASVILGCLVKHTSDSSDMTRLKIERLVQVWADSIADWNAWDEEEDLAVFDAMEEIIAFNARCPLQQFCVAETPLPPAPPVPPRSILEGMAAFVSSGMESAYAAATWRACRLSHTLLHSTSVSFEGEAAVKLLVCRFTEAAFGRLTELSSFNVPLAKPLILVISSCYVGLPDTVEKVLSVAGKTKDVTEPFLQWAEAMATLADKDADPGLVLETELKLGVMCLLKLVDRLANNGTTEKIAGKCLVSLLDAAVRLKEAQQTNKAEGEEDGNEDDDTNDNSEEYSEEVSDEEDEEEEREETEDEFLERYAETARELEEEAIEDAEGGTEEDGQDIELGVLALADAEKSLALCIQSRGGLVMEQALDPDLVCKFVQAFPHLSCLFPAH